jgi:hypothetical protein
MNIKEMIVNEDGTSRKVKFIYYRDQNLWYETENGFQFPVPIEDIGNATFLSEDRAILFLRYVRKHVTLIQNQ